MKSSGFDRYTPCPVCRANGRDSAGDNLANYKDGSSHCFACGHHVSARPFTYLLSRGVLELDNDAPKSVLPFDFQHHVPAGVWKWLLQYGLPWSYWRPFCGYSAFEERLVIRVGNPVRFSVGRFTGEAGPNTPRKWHSWGDTHASAEILSPEKGDGTIVVVEDIVSAHKVAQVCACMPLFGTAIYPAHHVALKARRGNILMWLDSDQDGSIKRQAAALQGLLGVSVDVRLTPEDPKYYPVARIREILDGEL